VQRFRKSDKEENALSDDETRDQTLGETHCVWRGPGADDFGMCGCEQKRCGSAGVDSAAGASRRGGVAAAAGLSLPRFVAGQEGTAGAATTSASGIEHNWTGDEW
jgi:hypothetical protein